MIIVLFTDLVRGNRNEYNFEEVQEVAFFKIK